MTTVESDPFAAARAVADAVLYEGYVLYPYGASSAKNQVRWQFGVLTPRAFAEADGSERWSMRTECLVEVGPTAVLSVRLRCLQLQHRGVDAPGGVGGELLPVERLSVGAIVVVDWDEAVERIVDVAGLALDRGALCHEERFALPGGIDIEVIEATDGSVAGRVRRQRRPVAGRVQVETRPVAADGGLVKVVVTVENTTAGGAGWRREEALGHSLLAVHTMLAVDVGTFLSVLDPPVAAGGAGCHSDGTFPVLVGQRDDVVLSSPIILYDHPAVAPESPGDLYDATEIDEILALRVLTLTDDEKAEARGTDPRAAAIIDRCDDMAPEAWDRLHGVMRRLGPTEGPEDDWSDPWLADLPTNAPWWEPAVDGSVDPWTDTVQVAGVALAQGDTIRLRPSHRADAQDIFLVGRTATVAGVFRNVDGETYLAVTVDDDPAQVEFAIQGRYLFFHPDEVEPLTTGEGAP